MIKALMGDNIVFGLSKLNVEKLQQGMPIAIDLAELGMPGKKVLILYGETEAAIVKELEAATGQNLTRQ